MMCPSAAAAAVATRWQRQPRGCICNLNGGQTRASPLRWLLLDARGRWLLHLLEALLQRLAHLLFGRFDRRLHVLGDVRAPDPPIALWLLEAVLHLAGVLPPGPKLALDFPRPGPGLDLGHAAAALLFEARLPTNGAEKPDQN